MTEPSTPPPGGSSDLPPAGSPSGSPVVATARVAATAHASPLARIREHKVLQWSLAYLGAALALAHGQDLVGHAFDWPEITNRIVIGALAVGFPIAVALAWYHGHKGLTRISAGEMTVVSVLLVIGAGLLMALVRAPTQQAGLQTNAPRPAFAATATVSTAGSPLASAAAPIVTPPAVVSPQRSIAVLPLDPFLPATHFLLGVNQLAAGHLSEAEAALNTALDIAPDYALAHSLMAQAQLFKGEKQAALTQIDLEPVETARWAGRAAIYYALGRKADSDAALRRLTGLTPEPNSAYFIACTHAYRGERDAAFIWLGRAFTQKDPALYDIKSSLYMNSIKEDPRYKAFLRKMQLPE